jgi:hypothetical protein
MSAQFPKQANELPGIGHLQHQGIAAGYGVVFPRTASARYAPDRHGLQPYQPKWFVLTVRQDRI